MNTATVPETLKVDRGVGLTDSRAVPQWSIWLARALVGLAFAWCYTPTFLGLLQTWDTDPNYSQGYLVPLLAAFVAWYRGRMEPRLPLQPSVSAGLAALAVAAVLRGVGSYFYVTPLDHLSLLLSIIGLVLLLAGRAWLVRVWPALLLLCFMFPIPAAVGGSELVSGLQTLCTKASVYVLETTGTTVYREGNVILLKSLELGIVEACSGLKMLMVFCALAVTTAVLLPMGPIRKVILALSAVPLAIICNIARITVAGLAGEAMGSETGHFIFHDLAGWLMVPAAFVLLTAEVLILAWLVRPRTPRPLTA